jgi:drug/metabolite transporter (DMT)-like permease
MFGAGPGNIVPGEVLVRAGACLIILSGIAHLSRRISRLPHAFGAVAQESLLIYFIHLCIVYGSVWNQGLMQKYGPTLTPGRTAAVVVVLMLAMVCLAWYWNWWKHARPRAARWTIVAVWAVLGYRLL